MAVRKVPRPFEFHWGKGLVTEEASVATPYHEPTVQLLAYDSGEKAIRFCGYEHGKMGRYPLVVSEEYLEALGREVRKNEELHRLLRKLVG
jgi:hypothetical protein